MKFLQRTRDSQSNSVEILKDLDHIEMAATQMEQHLGEIIAYVEDVIVSCTLNGYAIYIRHVKWILLCIYKVIFEKLNLQIL